MHLPKKIVIGASFLPVIIFLSLTAASAQTSVNYQFLEVVDEQEKPVADATVETFGYKQTLKTDENGRVEKLPLFRGDYNTSGFTVSKTGYYPFRYEFGDRFSYTNPIRVVLLKIPQTDAERRSIVDEQRKREFFAAARAADVETVRKFLKTGLSANLTTSDLRGVPEDKNIPIVAFAAKSGDSQTVNEFLAAGANVRQVPDILITYLWANPFTPYYPEREAERKEFLSAYEDTAGRLINAGANINPTGSAGTTALILAAKRGFFKTVKLLIEKGASVNAGTAYGATPLTQTILHLENAKARFEMVNLLIKSGADINLVTGGYNSCETALVSAVGRTDVKMVEFLLANGADVNLRCKNGESALTLIKNRRVYDKSEKVGEIIKLLENAGAK